MALPPAAVHRACHRSRASLRHRRRVPGPVLHSRPMSRTMNAAGDLALVEASAVGATTGLPFGCLSAFSAAASCARTAHRSGTP